MNNTFNVFGKRLLATFALLLFLAAGCVFSAQTAFAQEQAQSSDDVRKAIAQAVETSTDTITVASGLSSQDEVDRLVEGLDQSDLAHVLMDVSYVNGRLAYGVSVTAEECQDVDSPDQGEASYELTLGTNMTTDKFHDTLIAAWNKLDTAIDVSSFGISRGDIVAAVYRAIFDSPECFNVITSFSARYNPSTNVVTEIVPKYLDSTPEGYAAMKAKWDAAMAEAASAVKCGMSDRAVVLTLHDWLCARTVYNDEEAASQETQDWANYNAYGTMCTGTGVCQSYSLALSALLDQVGIEATVLSVDQMGHAWNLVKLEGSWYHIDATWNDDDNADPLRNWFLKSDNVMSSVTSEGNMHYGWTDSSDFGWDSSMVCSSTKYDTFDWSSFDPLNDPEGENTGRAHTAVTDPAVAATCTTAGKTEGSHCSVCGVVITAQQTVKALGHDYKSSVTKAATCTSDGVTTFKCTRCSDSRTEAVAKTGHTAVTDAAVAATCTTAGKTEGSHCSVCNAVITAQQDAPALGHKWGEWTESKAATVTSYGQEERVCAHDASHVETRQTAPAVPDDPIEAFASRLYTAILDRAPDAEGMAVQVNAIKSGTAPAEIAYNYFAGIEYQGKEETSAQTVERVYQVMFGRASDASGKASGWGTWTTA